MTTGDAAGGALSQGTHLSQGRYQLTAHLTDSNSVELWSGIDIKTGREVAVKHLTDPRDAHARNMLSNEARSASRIHSLHTVHVMDYWSDASGTFVIMELLSGPSLRKLMDSRSLTPSRALALLGDVAEGLAATHELGIVHRDVKPSNVLLKADGVATLIDFGIAIPAGSPALNLTGLVAGSADYLAPELTLGRVVTPAADIYSLGIVLLEALLGRKPFTGPTPEDTAAAHVIRAAPRLPAQYPSDLRILARMMTEKDPEQRPSGTLMLASLLRRYSREIA